MPLINNSLTYSEAAREKISEVKAEPKYDHTIWSRKDLEPVRCEVRDFYRKEQRLLCAYCQEKIGARSATSAPVEHIAPKSKYVQFMFEPQNLCVVCGDCNEYKLNREALAEAPLKTNPTRRYPTDSLKYRLFHPHFDEYEDHIIKAGFLYLQKTPKGAYTIYICNLNRFIETLGVSEEFVSNLETLTDRERFHRK